MEEIRSDDKLLAMIVRRDEQRGDGHSFATPPEATQQVGFLNFRHGHEILPHVHKFVRRTVVGTSEVVYVKAGLLKVDFFSSPRKYLRSSTLTQGDLVILMEGGHGFTCLEDCELMEIKQGPYLGVNADKERF